jgi:CTP synthase
MKRTIALVGDHSEAHTAHRAIPVALELARARTGADIAWEWVATRDIGDAPGDLSRFSGVWLVPASPYENTAGALGAVRFARESGRPFLGTCGGFQHAVLEIARDVAGIADADHAETNPGGASLVVTPLSCSHVEKTASVRFEEGSLLASAYGAAAATEGYRCNYGLNEAYRARLEGAGLRFTAWDEGGEIRGAELPEHPFFAGVLFQPERAALRGEAPPLVVAFARAAAAYPGSRACGGIARTTTATPATTTALAR